VLASGEHGVIVNRDKPNFFFLLAALNADHARLIVDPSKQRAAAPAVNLAAEMRERRGMVAGA
jgi:hypothetical protein